MCKKENYTKEDLAEIGEAFYAAKAALKSDPKELTFEGLKIACDALYEQPYASFMANHNGKSFEVRVYYIMYNFVVMSNHEGGDCWEEEGEYALNGFERFKEEFGIKG
jgi:hypothetical protein